MHTSLYAYIYVYMHMILKYERITKNAIILNGIFQRYTFFFLLEREKNELFKNVVT